MMDTSKSGSHAQVSHLNVKPEPLRFLSHGASRAELIRAAAENHSQWFEAKALASGGEIRQTVGITWTLTDRELTIAFPHVSSEPADEALDTITAEAFDRKLNVASCWSLTPSHPGDLGARVSARGFEWGWRPHWMALDLRNLGTDYSIPEDLIITVDDKYDFEVEDLPYYNRDEASRLRAMASDSPRRMWHFAACLHDRIVAHSVLYLTTGRLGVAGIYNVGVVPAARIAGIGKAISLAPCRFAATLGCSYALLNSAADFLYERIGFESLGYGQTWWMHQHTMAGTRPTGNEIAFTESVVRGNIAELDALGIQRIPADLDAPLPNGMTPMDLAIKARKPRSAAWLASHGATMDILNAWDLGWKARARRLLKSNPELVNRQTGSWQTTPLHTAAQRGDVSLARLLLSANPDLEIKDAEVQSTALGWARYFDRQEIVELLRQ